MEQKELLEKLSQNSSLNEVQEYIKKVIEIRGFSKQPVEKKLLLLIEEVGELAKSIRKEATNMSIDKEKIANYDSVESEIADVLIVLLSICNTQNINIYDALIEKEKINVNRVWSNEKK